MAEEWATSPSNQVGSCAALTTRLSDKDAHSVPARVRRLPQGSNADGKEVTVHDPAPVQGDTSGSVAGARVEKGRARKRGYAIVGRRSCCFPRRTAASTRGEQREGGACKGNGSHSPQGNWRGLALSTSTCATLAGLGPVVPPIQGPLLLTSATWCVGGGGGGGCGASPGGSWRAWANAEPKEVGRHPRWLFSWAKPFNRR